MFDGDELTVLNLLFVKDVGPSGFSGYGGAKSAILKLYGNEEDETASSGDKL